jgi:uncharacterized protein YggE
MKIQTTIAAALAAAALTAGHAAAQPSPPPREQTIRVTGTGEARARPDQATADFGVETSAVTAQAAAAENAQRMERVIAALVRSGVPRDRIETRDYNVYPDYDPRPMENGEPRVRGYRVMNTVAATMDDIDKVGGVIDAALAAGANRVNGVRFGLRDAQAFRRRAIDDAVRRARADAESLAAALGVELGMVREAYTADVAMGVPVMEQRMTMDMAAASAPTPISPSEQTVRATVVIVYSITGR